MNRFTEPPTLYQRTNGTRHNCAEHLQAMSADWTEPHGERCRQVWDQCSVCGEIYEDGDDLSFEDEYEPAKIAN